MEFDSRGYVIYMLYVTHYYRYKRRQDILSMANELKNSSYTVHYNLIIIDTDYALYRNLSSLFIEFVVCFYKLDFFSYIILTTHMAHITMINIVNIVPIVS